MDLIKFVEDFEEKLERRKIPFLPSDFVHGYLTGVSISPRLVMPNEWIDRLLGDAFEFKTKDDAEFIFSFLFELYNRIVDDLRNGIIFPLLPEVEDENGVRVIARDWCRGFIFATEFYQDEYFQYMAEDDDSLMDIFILNYLAEIQKMDELKLQELFASLKKDEMELIDSIPDIVLLMYDYFQENFYEDYYEDEFDDEMEKIKPIKKEIPKIGRNDPCPCGSGKKYKYCCGKGA